MEDKSDHNFISQEDLEELKKCEITDESYPIEKEPVESRYTAQSMEVAYEFGEWKVDQEGNMSFRNGRYDIDRGSLKDDDWFCHLFEKGWINWNEFVPAYFTACKINKIENVKIRIFYESALKS